VKASSNRRTAAPVVSRSLCSLSLEQGALGAALEDKLQAAELILNGRVEFFTSTTTRNIFSAMCCLGADALDVNLLHLELEREGHPVDFAALMRLDWGVVIEIPMAKRLVRLSELHRLRQLARLGERLQKAVYEPGVISNDLVAKIREWLTRLDDEVFTDEFVTDRDMRRVERNVEVSE
jgi:replicative DNA helicase